MSDETPGIATAGEGTLRPGHRPAHHEIDPLLSALITPGTSDPDAHEPDLWRGRGLLYALGTVMILWGVRGLWLHTSHKALLHTLRFMVVGLVAHDGVLAPTVFALGLLAVRLVPHGFKLPLQVGLLVGGVLTLMTIPLLRSRSATTTARSTPRTTPCTWPCCSGASSSA